MSTGTDTCPGCASPYSLHRRDCPRGQPDTVTLDSRIGVLQELATDSALELPPGLSLETWAEVGATLQNVEHAISWWLGDWWLYGERKYGELAAAAAPTGYAAETIRKAAWVAERIEPCARRTELTFGHHDAVAGLDAPDRDRLLDRAVREGMNRHHLREAAKKVRAAPSSNGNGHHPPEPTPAPACVHDYRCLHCGAVPDSHPAG